MKLTDKELGAVLAGLCIYQQHRELDVDNIATDGDQFSALTTEEIDELGDRLNIPAGPKQHVAYSLTAEEIEEILDVKGLEAEGGVSEKDAAHIANLLGVAIDSLGCINDLCDEAIEEVLLDRIKEVA